MLEQMRPSHIADGILLAEAAGVAEDGIALTLVDETGVGTYTLTDLRRALADSLGRDRRV